MNSKLQSSSLNYKNALFFLNFHLLLALSNIETEKFLESTNKIRFVLNCKVNHLILEIPYAVSVSEFLCSHTALWKYSTFKSAHIEQQIRVIFTVH